jgi:hypothetical protein
MADVFTVLAMDHAEVKVMLTELETGPSSATSADQGQPGRSQGRQERLIR